MSSFHRHGMFDDESEFNRWPDQEVSWDEFDPSGMQSVELKIGLGCHAPESADIEDVQEVLDQALRDCLQLSWEIEDLQIDMDDEPEELEEPLDYPDTYVSWSAWVILTLALDDDSATSKRAAEDEIMRADVVDSTGMCKNIFLTLDT